MTEYAACYPATLRPIVPAPRVPGRRRPQTSVCTPLGCSIAVHVSPDSFTDSAFTYPYVCRALDHLSAVETARVRVERHDRHARREDWVCVQVRRAVGRGSEVRKGYDRPQRRVVAPVHWVRIFFVRAWQDTYCPGEPSSCGSGSCTSYLATTAVRQVVNALEHSTIVPILVLVDRLGNDGQYPFLVLAAARQVRGLARVCRRMKRNLSTRE